MADLVNKILREYKKTSLNQRFLRTLAAELIGELELILRLHLPKSAKRGTKNPVDSSSGLQSNAEYGDIVFTEGAYFIGGLESPV